MCSLFFMPLNRFTSWTKINLLVKNKFNYYRLQMKFFMKYGRLNKVCKSQWRGKND